MTRIGKELAGKATPLAGYGDLRADVVRVIEDARRAAARSAVSP
jgi:hypothetical protein